MKYINMGGRPHFFLSASLPLHWSRMMTLAAASAPARRKSSRVTGACAIAHWASVTVVCGGACACVCVRARCGCVTS